MIIIVPQNAGLFKSGRRPSLETAMRSAQQYRNEIHVSEYKPYAEQAELEKIFQHTGPNPRAFEKWCFEQWFMVREWMREHNTELAFKSESDVLYFDNLDNFELPDNLLCSHPVSTSFVTREGIEFICDSIMKAFRENTVAELCAPEHIADFTLMRVFMEQTKQPAFMGTTPSLDPNICLPMGAAMYQDHRDIFFVDCQPHYLVGDTTIRLATLHCWGRAKFLMPEIWAQANSVHSNPVQRLSY